MHTAKQIADSIDLALSLSGSHPGVRFDVDDLRLIVTALRAQCMAPHKIMTQKEYNDMTVLGWHRVCRNVDGFGSIGFRYGEPTDTPADLRRLVIAARIVAFEDQSPEALKELDDASEAFADRVAWNDVPDEQ